MKKIKLDWLWVVLLFIPMLITSVIMMFKSKGGYQFPESSKKKVEIWDKRTRKSKLHEEA